MNSNRPSKPNLPVYLSPPSFFLQRGCTEPISFLASRILLLDHNINQCRLVPSHLLPRTPNIPLTVMDIVRKDFGKKTSQGFNNGEEES